MLCTYDYKSLCDDLEQKSFLKIGGASCVGTEYQLMIQKLQGAVLTCTHEKFLSSILSSKHWNQC